MFKSDRSDRKYAEKNFTHQDLRPAKEKKGGGGFLKNLTDLSLSTKSTLTNSFKTQFPKKHLGAETFGFHRKLISIYQNRSQKLLFFFFLNAFAYLAMMTSRNGCECQHSFNRLIMNK